MKIDKHIYFSNEEYARIKDYASINNISFSKAVCNLCASALNGNDILDRINKLDKSIEYIIKKQKVIYLLEEQIYSDMDFENVSNPKKSKSLNEFNKKIRNNYIND